MEWVGEDSLGEDSQKIHTTWPPRAENKWDRRFLHLATDIGGWSKDPSKKVGAVLVREKRILSTGYNGFPMGCEDEKTLLLHRSSKYMIIIHAEINAIVTAALHGVSTKGSTIYLTMHPCSNCTSALINAGVKRIVCLHDQEAYIRWGEKFTVAKNITKEVGVQLDEFVL